MKRCSTLVESTLLLVVILALASIAYAAEPAPTVCSTSNHSEERPQLTAIDILLHPDSTMLQHAKEDNARMRKNYPEGFALDKAHTPHVTVLQCYVRTKDLDAVYAAVKRIVEAEKPIGIELKTTGYYYIPLGDLGLAGITVAPTQKLLHYQQAIVDAISPYIASPGTGDAFVPNSNGAPINSDIVAYVNNFIPQHTGRRYGPHVTIGLAKQEFLQELLAAPYKPYAFKIVGAGVYHLGDFGTAQKELWTAK